MKNKKNLLAVLFLILALILCSCSSGSSGLQDKADIIFRFYHSKAGDAKMLNDHYLLTTINRSLYGIDILTGKVKKYDIAADWLDVIPSEGIVVYSNAQFELGIARFDEDSNLTDNEIIFSNAHKADYMIDPAIVKVDDKYYVSMTFVDGNLNNGDSSKEDGKYTIRFYELTDLKSLTYISDVVSAQRNLEDVKITYSGGRLYLLFEKEVLDMANSAIQLSVSEDMGNSWNAPVTLLDSVADQEPSDFDKTADGWTLYYSSDIAAPGKTYNGASPYTASFDENLNLISKDVKIDLDSPVAGDDETKLKGGVLLYSVNTFGNEIFYVFSENHLSDDNICVSKVIQ